MIGNKYNKLIVLERLDNDKFGNSKWLCKCECGNTVEVLGIHLRSGHTKSCGCLQKEKCRQIIHKPKHGMAKSRIYKIWNGMKNRTNTNSLSKDTLYKNYSGRGIKVCDEWRNSFKNFAEWSLANGYTDNLTIERVNNDKDYEPYNCKWVDLGDQANNRRSNVKITYNNETHNLSEWCKRLNKDYALVYNRIHKNKWDFERAISEPVHIEKRNRKD